MGLAYYTLKGDRIVFVHTEVEPAHEGKGLGGELARAALDDARKQGTPIVPLCPFIAAFVRKNPQYLELVAPELRLQLSEIDEA